MEKLAQATTDKPIDKLKEKAIQGEISPESVGETSHAATVPKPVRHYRALIFQGYMAAAALGFAFLFVLARQVAYTSVDLSIERAVQTIQFGPFDFVMRAISGIGYNPIVYVLCALLILLLYVVGLRWESVMLFFAGAGVSVLGALVKVIVQRARPTPELVNVFAPLNDYSFPSGHTLLFTAFYGFMWFLIYTLLKHGWGRNLGLVVFGSLVAFVGLSRVYLGQHWPSDVLGAYLLGSLWLALTIYVYRWGKPRFFVTQPVAPETGLPDVQPAT